MNRDSRSALAQSQDRTEQGESGMPEVFRAGEKVPTTGVYKTVHAHEHVPAHYVTALFGDTFPACSECSDEVRFQLAMSAIHVKAHPQFRR